MVILGVLLVGVTLMYPPYYGRGGTDESDTSICKSGTSMCKSSTSDESKGRRWYERTGANLLRVYIDLAQAASISTRLKTAGLGPAIQWVLEHLLDYFPQAAFDAAPTKE